MGRPAAAHKERLKNNRGAAPEALSYEKHGKFETYRCRSMGRERSGRLLAGKSAPHPRGRQAGARRKRKRLIEEAPVNEAFRLFGKAERSIGHGVMVLAGRAMPQGCADQGPVSIGINVLLTSCLLVILHHGNPCCLD